MKDWARLAAVLLKAVGDEVANRGSPVWVRVLDPPDGDPDEGFALALSDESAGLLGWVATPDCQAVGLVATGRLRSLPGAPPPDGAVLDLGEDRLRMACLMTREGEVAWKVELPGGSHGPTRGAGIPEEAPSEGRMLDCLRRCFALPTPAPPVTPERLQAIAWLVAIFDRAIDALGRLTWSEVWRLHPVAQVLNAEPGGPHGDLLPGLLRVAGSAWSWEDFRQLAQRDGSLAHLVEPHLAAWMDEGMFARWLLSELPGVDELLDAVRPRLVPSAARRLAHAIHGSGLTEATGPAR
jgi:hypothetical protein